MGRVVPFVLLLAIAAAAVPLAVGFRAEEQYREAVAALDEATGPGPLEVWVEDYEQGWLRSYAITSIEPVTDATVAGERQSRILLHHEIEHGPFPWSHVASEDFDGRPVLASVATWVAIEEETPEAVSEQDLPLVIEALLPFAEEATVWILPDESLVGSGEGWEVDWEETGGEVTFRYDGTAFSGSFELPRVAFEDPGGDGLRIEDQRYVFDYREHPTGLWVGSGHFRLGLLHVRADGHEFVLRDLEVRDDGRVEGGFWGMTLDGSLRSVRNGGALYGPGELALRVDGFATGPMREVAGLVQVLGEEGEEAEAAKVEAMTRMPELWGAVVDGGPEIELSRFRFGTPDGELRMALRLGLDTEDPMARANPMFAMQAVELDAEFSVPQPILHRWLARPVAEPASGDAPSLELPTLPFDATAQIASLLSAGVIERHDGHYVLGVRVRKGALRLNGRVIPFQALLGAP